jgi:hypothetical protein
MAVDKCPLDASARKTTRDDDNHHQTMTTKRAIYGDLEYDEAFDLICSRSDGKQTECLLRVLTYSHTRLKRNMATIVGMLEEWEQDANIVEMGVADTLVDGDKELRNSVISVLGYSKEEQILGLKTLLRWMNSNKESDTAFGRSGTVKTVVREGLGLQDPPTIVRTEQGRDRIKDSMSLYRMIESGGRDIRQ